MDDDDLAFIAQKKEKNKRKIIALFLSNVKGKKADVSLHASEHDGKYGHWLEEAMGVARNAKNEPDLLGFEMKNTTLNKTTFGDWSADYRIFSIRSGGSMSQDEFLRAFGQPNTHKNNRLAWSGRIVPNIKDFNYAGQKLIIDSGDNILAIYCYSRDSRTDKDNLVPSMYRKENLVLAKWSAKYMKMRVEDKFNQNGWFKCLKNAGGQYTEIVFGEPITFKSWIRYVKSGDVIFDSGMHQGNPRPYASWRSSNTFWDKLITSRYS